jgi:hypothetical protein
MVDVTVTSELQLPSDPSYRAYLDCLCLVEKLYQQFRSSGTVYPIDLLRIDLRLTHLALFSRRCSQSDTQAFLRRARRLARELGLPLHRVESQDLEL